MKPLSNIDRLNLIDDLKKAQYGVGTISDMLSELKHTNKSEVKLDVEIPGSNEFPRLPVSANVFKKMLEAEKVELESTISEIISKLHSALDLPREEPVKEGW